MRKIISKAIMLTGIIGVLGFGSVQSVRCDETGYYSKTNAPEFYGLTKAVIKVGDDFASDDTRYRIFARDFEDGDLTSAIEIVSNTVDSSKSGDYEIEYMVSDSDGNKSELTVPVTVKDECENRYFERTLYSLPSVANMELAGTNRGNAHDRQMLGFYMEQGSSVRVKIISGADKLNLNYWNNDSNTEFSKTITHEDIEITSDVAGGVPFIKTAYDAKEPVVVGITVGDDMDIGKVKELSYYHYQDNEKDFFTEWEASTDSYAVIESEDVTVLVPYDDRKYLINYYNKCHTSLDGFLSFWHKTMNQYDEFMGLSYDAEDAIDQNVKTKYFFKANAHGVGAAYYGGSHVGVNRASVASIFEVNWGGLHEVGHGYQGSLANTGMPLGEVSNNILGHYVQINRDIYTYNDDWLGSIINIEQNINSKRLDGTAFSELAANEQLYLLINLLDTYEPKKTYAQINKLWRRALRDKQNITSQEAYVLGMYNLYDVNVAPYFEAWGLSISDSVKDKVAGSTILFPLADMVGDIEQAESVRKNLSKEGIYSLVSARELKDYNMTGSIKVSLTIDDIENVMGKKIVIQSGGEYRKEITITGKNMTIENVPAGTYEVKLPVPKQNIYEYVPIAYTVVKNGVSSEVKLTYENDTEFGILGDTVIRFNGLGDAGFATITFGNNNMTVISNATSPHVYFTDEYAVIKVYNDRNELVYSKTYIGNENSGAAKEEIAIGVGYKIQIMHREATTRLVPCSNILGDTDTTLAPIEKNTTYIVGEYGLYKEALEDESYNNYKTKLDEYIKKIFSGLSENDLNDENVATVSKKNILVRILKLKETEKMEYLEKYGEVLNGSNPDTDNPDVTRTKPKKVTSLKQKTSYYTSVIDMSWKKVVGAKGYEIYRASSKNGKYKKIKSTESTRYSSKKLKAGTKYYYKVRAYKVVDGSRVYGSFSSVVVMSTRPKAPIVKVTAGRNKAKVIWKKVTGANGYEVSRSVKKNGKYTTIKRVSSKTISYAKKKITENRTYYFRVRAYKIVNGKKIYSGWSRVKSVRVKI